MVSGFGDLQYMWSIWVAFLSDARVGNAIIGRRYSSASVSYNSWNDWFELSFSKSILNSPVSITFFDELLILRIMVLKYLINDSIAAWLLLYLGGL